MTHVLDTNAASGLVKGDSKILTRMRTGSRLNYAVSVIVMSELWFGAFKSPQSRVLIDRLQALDLPLLTFEHDDARCAGEIRNILRQAGTPIGPYDVPIAGQALARNLTVVTHNTREFARVPGLRVEDWAA